MKITATDFFGAFFCALRVHADAEQFQCGNNFNLAMEAAFKRFQVLAREFGFTASFRIRLDPLHLDSKTIEEGLLTGIRSDFIGLDNPDFEKFRMKIPASSAVSLLEKMPGNPQIYNEVAATFYKEYSQGRAAEEMT